MIANTDCTVYRYDAITGGFDRHYISDVMWQESKASNVLKSGLQSADSTTVYIPPEHAKKAPQTASKDMLIKGNCGFVFDNTSPQSISKSLMDFRKRHSFVTVMVIDCKDYGSLQHIKISAR